MRFSLHLFALSVAAPLLACSSTPAATTTITRPELVAVSPSDFLGLQRCGQGDGLVGSYVATLFDVTPASDGGLPEGKGDPLPSSPATSCYLPVTFSFVLAQHRYRAEIDAYDRLPRTPAEKLDPTIADPTHIDAANPGERTQLDGAGEVAPRWTTVCGGYPPTVVDAGVADAGVDLDAADADAGNEADATPPGVVSYDTLTTTVHDCPGGLKAVE